MDEKQRMFLGLNKNEHKVVNALLVKAFGIAELSREINIPKTTLNYLVLKLKRRGILESIPNGKRKLWQIQNREIFSKSIAGLNRTFLAGKDWGVTTIPVSTDTSIEIYRGTKSLYSLWQKLSSLPRLKRVYAIQPDLSFNLAIEHFLKFFSYSDLTKINEDIKKNKIIIEAIVHENSTETVSEKISQRGMDPREFLASFSGRIADTVKLPEGFMNRLAEMYVYDDFFIVINWENDFAFSVKNSEISTFFKEMFDSLKFLCKKYDQNEKAARKIVELSS